MTRDGSVYAVDIQGTVCCAKYTLHHAAMCNKSRALPHGDGIIVMLFIVLKTIYSLFGSKKLIFHHSNPKRVRYPGSFLGEKTGR